MSKTRYDQFAVPYSDPQNADEARKNADALMERATTLSKTVTRSLNKAHKETQPGRAAEILVMGDLSGNITWITKEVLFWLERVQLWDQEHKSEGRP